MNSSFHRQLVYVTKRVLAPPQLQLSCRACSTNLVQTSLEDKQMERFIPMTRRTLLRKLTENTHLVAPDEREQYMEFVKGLESSISHQFHGSLKELKQLYDPLNPDKETLVGLHINKKEKQEQEFWLLQKLSSLLEKAHFQEIPRNDVAKALEDHPCYEGVMVKVDMKKFDVIKFWALGEEEVPLHYDNFRERIRNQMYVYMKKWPKNMSTYKRVVVAVRSKKQNKLFLKAFKDIPTNGLEYILPEGKISISKFDAGLMATGVTIGALSVGARLLSSAADMNLSWTSIVGGMTALLALQSWSAYKNKRNKYLVELAKTFYYKALANNRALLTLVTDRAEDEVFKASLLAYTFILKENVLRETKNSTVANTLHMDQLVSVRELNDSIEHWMSERYDVNIHFDGRNALQQLEQLGLLKSQKLGEEVHLQVKSLADSIRLLPMATSSLDVEEDREEELDLEQIVPVTDTEIADVASRVKQREAEFASPGWQ